MRTVLIVAASITIGIAMVVVGAMGHAQRLSNSSSSNEPSGRSERVAGVPAKLPEPQQWQFVTNPGVSAAVTRFFRMVQDDTIKADSIFAAPVLMDDKLLPDMDKVSAFVDEAREKAPRDEKSHTILSMKMLPPGNNFAEAQNWFGRSFYAPKLKKLFDHANEQKAWIVLVSLATRDGPVSAREGWFAVKDVETEEKARVVGFMD